MIKIKKNFLSLKEHKELFEIISGSYFPYYAMPYQVKLGKSKNKQEHLLQHILMNEERINSSYFEKLIVPFALNLSIDKMLYARLNLIINQNKAHVSAWHTDFINPKKYLEKAHTAVYYFNTNNGATEIKGHKKIKSIKNQMVIFPSKLQHRSIQQTDTTFRWVLNLNYLPK